MADDVTSWIARALIDQAAGYGGDYQAARRGFLVQVTKVRRPSSRLRALVRYTDSQTLAKYAAGARAHL